MAVRAKPPAPSTPGEGPGGMPMDFGRQVASAANAALARLSAGTPEAAAALDALPASEFATTTQFGGSASGGPIAYAGGARFLAKKLADAKREASWS